jgi:hypothetical protein
MHAGSCQLLLMRACARRAYCKKCRVNLGSKRSGWPNVPVLTVFHIIRTWNRVPFARSGGCAMRESAKYSVLSHEPKSIQQQQHAAASSARRARAFFFFFF